MISRFGTYLTSQSFLPLLLGTFNMVVYDKDQDSFEAVVEICSQRAMILCILSIYRPLSGVAMGSILTQDSGNDSQVGVIRWQGVMHCWSAQIRGP